MNWRRFYRQKHFSLLKENFKLILQLSSHIPKKNNFQLKKNGKTFFVAKMGKKIELNKTNEKLFCKTRRILSTQKIYLKKNLTKNFFFNKTRKYFVKNEIMILPVYWPSKAADMVLFAWHT